MFGQILDFLTFRKARKWVDGNMSRRDSPGSSTYAEDDGSNGLVLKGVYIPEEVVVLILSNLDAKSLVKSRLVCRRWRDMASGPAWHSKVLREIPNLTRNYFRKFSWKDFFWMCHKRPFQRNLLTNSCGEEDMELWHVTNGGSGWAVEKEPQGSDPLPGPFPSCFVTSYSVCAAEQCIDLVREGVCPEMLDRIKPEITFSEWYVARFDCGGEYKVALALLNERWEEIVTLRHEDILTDEDRVKWRQVKRTVETYEPGLRFLKFYHAGKDTQFWNGHYGIKMTGASVTLALPKTFPPEEIEIPTEKEPSEDIAIV